MHETLVESCNGSLSRESFLRVRDPVRVERMDDHNNNNSAGLEGPIASGGLTQDYHEM